MLNFTIIQMKMVPSTRHVKPPKKRSNTKEACFQVVASPLVELRGIVLSAHNAVLGKR